MRTTVVEVNGQCLIPLPQELLDAVGIIDEVDIEIRDGALVVEPAMRTCSPEEVEFLMQRLEQAHEDVRLGNTFTSEEVFRAARERVAQRLSEQQASGGDGGKTT